MAGKSLGKTVLGWFVVQEDEQAPTSDELIAKYADGATLAKPPIELQGELPKAVAGQAIDFAAVYRAAQISDEEQERVARAYGLLQTLPADTSKDVRKQIVEASLRAFGFPIDHIIEAAAQEIQALEAYIRHGEQETQAVLTEGNQQLEQLAQQMADVKRAMEAQVKGQQDLARAANEQKLPIQAVLEFFGQEAVARVVKESPKLIEPE